MAERFKTLEKEFCHVAEYLAKRPDYARLEALLVAGVDVNASDGNNETILSETIPDFGNLRDIYTQCGDGAELPRYVRFMLDHGFDVTRNGGGYGAEVLSYLLYNPCDHYMVEAARMLLDAGADSAYVEGDESSDVRDNYVIHADDAVVNYHDCKDGMVYSTIAEMMWLQQQHKDYSVIQLYTVALGRKIEDVYACDNEWGQASYRESAMRLDGTQASDVYTGNLIITCDGLALSVDHGMGIMVNPHDITEHKVSLRDVLAEDIGETIERIHFGCRDVKCPKGWSSWNATIVLTLSNGNSLQLDTDYSENGDDIYTITRITAEERVRQAKEDLIQKIHDAPDGVKVLQIRSTAESRGDMESDHWWAHEFVFVTEVGIYRITGYAQGSGTDYVTPIAIERIAEYDPQEYSVYVDATEDSPITLKDYEFSDVCKECGEGLIVHYKNHHARLVGISEEDADLYLMGALGVDGEWHEPDDVAWDYKQEGC